VTAKGEGLAHQWLLEHRSHPDKDNCLIWPFCRVANGRGALGYNGDTFFAHRYMCMLAHGEPPTSEHHAAHSCGKGHEGCVNPHHLSWKTPSENLQDCAEHGTTPKNAFGPRGRFSPHDILAIRELLKFYQQRAIANMLGVSETIIGNIATGRFYSRPSKLKYWTEEEDAKIRDGVARGLTFAEMAKEIGRATNSTANRAYRLGLRSGQPCFRKTS